ncbi:MAG: hypothetical protein JRJ46_00835, partial [Deltaproteobacteria bacterium]|nr:hypothetical protein [Deltaproteobacteria bacterium]
RVTGQHGLVPPNEYYAPGQITWLANVRQQAALYTANGCMRPGGDGDGFQ